MGTPSGSGLWELGAARVGVGGVAPGGFSGGCASGKWWRLGVWGVLDPQGSSEAWVAGLAQSSLAWTLAPTSPSTVLVLHPNQPTQTPIDTEETLEKHLYPKKDIKNKVVGWSADPPWTTGDGERASSVRTVVRRATALIGRGVWGEGIPFDPEPRPWTT